VSSPAWNTYAYSVCFVVYVLFKLSVHGGRFVLFSLTFLATM